MSLIAVVFSKGTHSVSSQRITFLKVNLQRNSLVWEAFVRPRYNQYLCTSNR